MGIFERFVFFDGGLMGLEDRLDTMGDSMGLNDDLMMINGSLFLMATWWGFN